MLRLFNPCSLLYKVQCDDIEILVLFIDIIGILLPNFSFLHVDPHLIYIIVSLTI